MWLLLPLTLSIGTSVLWFHARTWPKSVDADGILDRRGNRIAWKSVEQIGALRVGWSGAKRTIRLDIDYRDGSGIRVPVRALYRGEEVARQIVELFEQARGRPPRQHGGWKPVSRASDLPDAMITSAEIR